MQVMERGVGFQVGVELRERKERRGSSRVRETHERHALVGNIRAKTLVHRIRDVSMESQEEVVLGHCILGEGVVAPLASDLLLILE